MEPLSTAAIAVATIIATKALEKTGENIGEIFWDKSQQFITTLNKDAPETAKALKRAPEQPLDYGQAVLEVETATRKNPELAQASQELIAAAEAESNLKVIEILKKIKETLTTQQPTIQNLGKLADKINNLNQAQTIHLTQHNTF